jgi:hypothetical protein
MIQEPITLVSVDRFEKSRLLPKFRHKKGKIFKMILYNIYRES